ncbi:hypothetical protein TVNIR_3772 [Thioalkalivibrio nitratireducens DSM 14787]|uniref:PA2779 family protein n=1 Tax=Thioalkalivibrio nitratireducens (strain DSM 14787 / UNIQEM 213 / ALEN2) TaxID=1255043 RepID=L0E2H8_THIND|nr:PA2779 family protein [Thioalkalivibrio nitratireducens]AGA35400.1 hypothetical protein TVNIR_3772 [Thioalkalivibrio nitratireducens DSM 14787]
MTTPGRWCSRLLVLCCTLFLTSLPATPVLAGMLDTDALIAAAGAESARAALVQRLDSQELGSALARLGVDPADARARVARLTDAEAAELHARLDAIPVGAGALETVLIVLLVFVITDALGITDVFSFVRPAR